MSDTLIALSSCQYPADFFRYRCAYQSLGAIADLFGKPSNRSAHRVLLLAGDSIYADATAGLFDAADPHERFTQQYHKLRSTWAWTQIDAHERMYSIDDHELTDNWEPLDASHPDTERRDELERIRKAGEEAFIHEMGVKELSGGTAYYQSLINGYPLFVMDTRTERESRKASNIKQANMCHSDQIDRLLVWIDHWSEMDKGKRDSDVSPKYIMSGSMMLPRLRTTAHRWDPEASCASSLWSDGWDGYPKTMHKVLSHILKRGLRRVIFLSGDAHIPCICNVKVTDGENCVSMVSVHGSALNAPLPFANATPSSFCAKETFSLLSAEGKDAISVESETEFPEVGDGFCVFKLSHANAKISCKAGFAGRLNNYSPSHFYDL